jgi:hypothetical protein
MELTFDSEYKARAIRGFCHLYDGQEAIAAGLKGAWRAALCEPLDFTSVARCHCPTHSLPTQPRCCPRTTVPRRTAATACS